MEDKAIITQVELISKLAKSNIDNFDTAILFNSYFKDHREYLVNQLKASNTQKEDIGIIDFLGIIINKINQIQEKRNER
jgi:hypothetical protein